MIFVLWIVLFLIVFLLFIFFFFFQAEDGIRDGRVTGVQTCALPIYRGHRLHRHRPPDALPRPLRRAAARRSAAHGFAVVPGRRPGRTARGDRRDRKSTRLNSSHPSISYAVFCLKKKRKNTQNEDEKQ